MDTDHFTAVLAVAFDREQPPQDQIAALNELREILDAEGVSLEVRTKWAGAPDTDEQVFDLIADEIADAESRL